MSKCSSLFIGGVPLKQFDLISPLLQIDDLLRKRFTQSSSAVAVVNEQIARLSQADGVPAVLIVGETIHCTPYSRNVTTVGQVRPFQAVLCVPSGVGITVWNELHEALDRSTKPKAIDDVSMFVPFGNCEPAIQSLILAELPPMLVSLYGFLRSQIANLS